MSRKLLSLGALAVGFTLVLGVTEVEARHCSNRYSSRSCCQTGNYSRSLFSVFNRCNNGPYQQVYYNNQQPVNYGCQVQVQQRCQPVQYISSNTRCIQQPACHVVQTGCENVQTAYATSEIQTHSPATSPPLDNAPPPPAATGRFSAPDSAPAPTLAPGR